LQVIGLCLILAMLNSVAVALGRSRPEELDFKEALGLTTCGDEPCILGFVPNVTSWSESRDIVMQYPDIFESGDWIDFKFSHFVRRIMICPSTSDATKLGYVGIAPNLSGRTLPVSEVIARYGPPCTIYADINFLILMYDSFAVRIFLDGRLEFSTRVSFIDFYNGPFGDNPCINSHPQRERWRGFTQYHHSP
jgi:hypothetical protein